jgi:hypothetical protein
VSISIRQGVAKQIIDPDTNEVIEAPISIDDEVVAGVGPNPNPVIGRHVARDFAKTALGQRCAKLVWTDDAEPITIERMNILYPHGWRRQELAEAFQRAIDTRDAVPAPPPAQAAPEANPEDEFAAWSNTASTLQRQQRRENDPAYRAWHECVSREQRTGTDVRAEDVKTFTQNRDLLNFVQMFKTTPTSVLRPRNGWVTTPGFLSGQMTEAEFNEWIDTATQARLI